MADRLADQLAGVAGVAGDDVVQRGAQPSFFLDFANGVHG